MQIIEIYPPYLYSIEYENDEQSIFDKLLYDEWQNVDSIADFLGEEPQFIHNPHFKDRTPESAALQISNEANFLDEYFEKLVNNADRGTTPDLETHFKPFGGKYGYELDLAPMESYGKGRPSLVRLYAIRIDCNKYLITDGGIKLADTVQESVGLKEHVIQNFDRVLAWLKDKEIMNGDDLEEYIINE